MQAPAAGQEEAEEQERLDAPKVVQELQRWSGIATWCSVPGPELSPAPPEICFTKHRKSTEVRPEKFSLECSTTGSGSPRKMGKRGAINSEL